MRIAAGASPAAIRFLWDGSSWLLEAGGDLIAEDARRIKDEVAADLLGQPGLRPIGLEDVSADLLAQCLLRH